MRMDQKNPINGSDHISTSVTGRTIRRTALEYSITLTETSMREDGVRTKGMGRAHSGLLIPKANLGGNILETGK
jgi:hypothetical protein